MESQIKNIIKKPVIIIIKRNELMKVVKCDEFMINSYFNRKQ